MNVLQLTPNPDEIMSQIPTEALTASIALKVPFHDIDVTGVAWHGRYLKYFELARDVLMDKINFSYQEMRDSGYIFPVVDAQVRYLRPLRLHQQLQVTAVMKEWEMRVVVEYRIHDLAGVNYSRGKTVQVAVKADSWELLLGSPKVWLDQVDRFLAQAAE